MISVQFGTIIFCLAVFPRFGRDVVGATIEPVSPCQLCQSFDLFLQHIVSTDQGRNCFTHEICIYNGCEWTFSVVMGTLYSFLNIGAPLRMCQASGFCSEAAYFQSSKSMSQTDCISVVSWIESRVGGPTKPLVDTICQVLVSLGSGHESCEWVAKIFLFDLRQLFTSQNGTPQNICTNMMTCYNNAK